MESPLDIFHPRTWWTSQLFSSANFSSKCRICASLSVPEASTPQKLRSRTVTSSEFCLLCSYEVSMGETRLQVAPFKTTRRSDTCPPQRRKSCHWFSRSSSNVSERIMYLSVIDSDEYVYKRAWPWIRKLYVLQVSPFCGIRPPVDCFHVSSHPLGGKCIDSCFHATV